MHFPALMSSELDHYHSLDSSAELLKKLKEKPADMVTFLESACEDHTWLEENETIVLEMLQWLNKRFYEEKLDPELVKRLVLAIQRNYSSVRSMLFFPNALYYNLTLLVKDKPFLINSLLYGSQSEKFKSLIKRTWNLQLNEAKIDKLSLDQIPLIDEFVNEGTTSLLKRADHNQIVSVMRTAAFWGLHDLAAACAAILARYLNKENVLDTILTANQEGFFELKKEACKFFNTLDRGILLSVPSNKEFSLEFLHFKGIALEAFNKFADIVTHLVFSGNTTDDPEIVNVIHKCPNLISIDLKGSNSFNDNLNALPPNLKEINLSYCSWIDDQTFEKIVSLCPNLEKLSLAHDNSLTFVGLSQLANLPRLQQIDLEDCKAVDDEGLKLVAQSASSLENVSLRNCNKITDQGVSDAVRWWRRLTTLDLSRCPDVGDGALFEIGRHCPELHELRLVRCREITTKGVDEILRSLHRLQLLDLTSCYLKTESVEDWKNQFPLINILFKD
jgi:F-box and leucine-rich repeat protein 2/20